MRKLLYLGPSGTFSEIIAKKFRDKLDVEIEFRDSFADIVQEVLNDSNKLALLPIENSSTSDVHENIDFLFENNLHIVHEAYLQVNLHLIAKSGMRLDDIEAVASYPKALAQCSKFIREYGLNQIFSESTSKAINYADDKTGFIASKSMLRKGYEIVKTDIGNSQTNLTRFLVVSNSNKRNLKGDKLTVIFKLPHTPGSLAKLLTRLGDQKLNLMKIESRPIPDTNFEYMFWIDVLLNNKNSQIVKDILKDNTLDYEIKGIYKKGNIFES
jgi:prephenate dehydratase